jgi:hypothetical protein
MVVIPGLTRNPGTLKATSLDTGVRRYDRSCGFYNVVLNNSVTQCVHKFV